MERVLAGIPCSHCMVYLDDLLVHAGDFKSELSKLREFFTAMFCTKMRLAPYKMPCFLDCFLGHVISERGVATDPAKVTMVRDWPVPANIWQLQSFLGLASYYCHFVKDFVTIVSPVHRLTQKGHMFVWYSKCQ